MIPDVFYFAAYVCVLDEKIYDECYFKMMTILEQDGHSDEVKNELLKILGDDENKISLDVVLQNLKNASDADKDSAIGLGLDVALADDYWADDEKLFFENACRKIDYPDNKFENLFNSIKLEADEEVEKDVDITKKIYGKLFFQLMTKIVPNNFKEQFRDRYINCLLSGPDYNEAIKHMRTISNEDIVYAKEALNKLSDSMTLFLTSLHESENKVNTIIDKLKRKKEDEDITTCLNGIKSQVTEFVSQTRQQVSVSLKEKEIAAKYYTISFMGRTKAGKSTLHSVILGGINKEFIGVGKERTTRFNRIYKWNGIRIIDTPGIGAPGGKSDTEIAKSVVDESDLICYVVTSDSIQETEFSFLKELKKQNKPIIILLNKKENLGHPIHRKRFLENPLYWYERTDNDSIEGHLIRIKEYAEKYYNNSYFDIFPVQLMAAQLSINENDNSLKKQFYKGSRIQQFLDDLRIQILENGKIKRSQTMLNGTIYLISKYKEVFDSQINDLKAIKEALKKNGDTSINKIKKIGKNTVTSLNNGLNAIYDDFIQTDIRLFSNEYYNLKKEALDSQWKKYYNQTGFENKIKDRIERETESYKNEIEEIIKEFSENLNFAFDTLNVKFDLRSTFDTKKLIAITGSLTGLVGSILLFALGASNPVGWVVFGVGAVVGVIASFFKSKDKKIKEAQDKLYESIKTSFDQNRAENINRITNDFEKVICDTEKKIDTLFVSLQQELDKIIHDLTPLRNVCNHYEQLLNQLYAIRILNFAQGKEVFQINDESLLKQIKVKHDFANNILIKTNLVKQLDTEKLKHILQEDILLEAL